jgi:hypothetical protein
LTSTPLGRVTGLFATRDMNRFSRSQLKYCAKDFAADALRFGCAVGHDAL